MVVSEVMPTSSRAVESTDVTADLQRFEGIILSELERVGLPTAGVVVELHERTVLLGSLGAAMRQLPEEQRAKALYISKMVMSGAVGQFDAALNYLWDETISELRRRVAEYDLGYFYDVAVPGDMRKYFSGVEDLPRLQDASLLTACREIGLLSDVGYQQVDLIRFMRNYASAAHPNQVQLSGLQLASWLETCIREVITLRPDWITAHTGRLLANIKGHAMDASEVAATASFFEDLGDRADTLALGFFGLYTDPKRAAVVADNVRRLWPELWLYVGDDTRHNLGVKYGRFAAEADNDKATAARELIDLVEGTAYLPQSIREAEIDTAIDALMTAHNGFNNFYNEPGPARTLAALAGGGGHIPEGVVPKYVRVVVKVFLGNGYGVSGSALPYYEQMIAGFDPRQAARALRAFTDPTVYSVLRSTTGRQQWRALLDLLGPKLTLPADRALFDAVRAFPGPLDMLHADANIKRLAGTRRNSPHRSR
jgi:hypothetical protein